MNGRKHDGVGGVRPAGSFSVKSIIWVLKVSRGFGQGHAGQKGHFSFRAGTREYGDALLLSSLASFQINILP